MSGLPEPVAGGPRALTVVVLGGEARVTGPGINAVTTGDIAHLLVACLASAWPEFLRRWEITERLGWSPSDEALQKQISRLRAQHIPIETKRDRGYRLEASGIDLDITRFTSLAGEARDSRSAEGARASLDLWSGDLPTGVARSPLLLDVVDLKEEMRSLAALRPKRALVVEDLLGPELAQGLRGGYRGEIEVLVADSFEQFLEVEEELETFDVVLVDFHLGGNDDQFLGLTVADRIKSSATVVPVLGMSWARPGRRDDEHTSLKYDLWAFVAKGSSSDTSAVDEIVSTAIGFLNSQSLMLDHYAQRNEALARRARLRIASERATAAERKAQSSRMEREFGYLVDALARRELRRLRRLSSEFYEQWCR
ncbi:hypothetical protein [Microbacterium sp. NPDC056569]|uniref:hypothetical protein n=1 Tax=Microbacterium sp. NPDC056569 TaxID=3345867 RepID=UPI00367133F0